MTPFLPLVAAIGPMLLWPIEIFLPYPFIVEEVFKAILVYFILHSRNNKYQQALVISSAILFSLSESILYLFNIVLTGNSQIFLLRLGLTTTMHLSTFLIIYLLGKVSIKLLPLGILIGAIIHYLYNHLVSVFY
jgi:uncharacterized membrane protein